MFIYLCQTMRVRDEVKEQTIRKEAISMIVANGFEGLSMQRLAKLAGVSPATIYIYFKDRDDLITQLAVDETTRMAEATLAGFSPDMDFAAGMRVQWSNRLKYCLENPEELDFLEQIRHSPFYEKTHKLASDLFRKTMQKFLKNAIAKGEMKEMPEEVFWSVAFAPFYNLLRFHIAGRSMSGKPFKLSDKMLDLTLKLVLKALKP